MYATVDDIQGLRILQSCANGFVGCGGWADYAMLRLFGVAGFAVLRLGDFGGFAVLRFCSFCGLGGCGGFAILR